MNYKNVSVLKKIYRRRLTAIKDNFDVIHPQKGTGIYNNTNDVIKNLHSFLRGEAAGNTSGEVRNETIDLID